MKAWGYLDDKTKVEVLDFNRFIDLGGILYMDSQGNGSLDLQIPKDYTAYNMFVMSVSFAVTYIAPQNGKKNDTIYNPQNVRVTSESNGIIRVTAKGFDNVYLANVSVIALDTTKMRYA